MTLLAVISVLLLEQARPLAYQTLVVSPLGYWADFLEHRCNGGDYRHGVIAWSIGVLIPVLISLGVFFLLQGFSPILAWLWNVLVLYLTLGFRQFSHFYTDMYLALRMDDLSHARALLAEWRGESDDANAPGRPRLTSAEVVRLAIREALVATHRHVFGVLAFFVVFPGPSGAVLYRVAVSLARHWSTASSEHPSTRVFGEFAWQAFRVLDWLPIRLTALGFAIVGNFEAAAYSWRNREASTDEALSDYADVGVILAAGAGALGLRNTTFETGADDTIGMVASGDDLDTDTMQAAVGLIWRALLLWLLLILLLSLAGLVRT